MACLASYDGGKKWYERFCVVDVQLLISQVSFVSWFFASWEAMEVVARVSRRSLAAVVVAVLVALWLRLRRLPPPKFQRPTCTADCPSYAEDALDPHWAGTCALRTIR